MTGPLVSVVVPTLNSGDRLGGCLDSIRRQTYPHVEIIVVDNFSSDDTVAVAERYGARVLRQGPERVAQVNHGVRQAAGVYAFFTGADMVVEPTYLEECVDKCEREGCDAIYASVRTLGDHFWARVKGLERETYIGDDVIESARFFKRDVFLALGGYDEELGFGGDDYDLQRRLDKAGYKTGRIGAREWHTGEATSLVTVFRKAAYYSSSIRGYVRRHPGHSVIILSPVRPAFVRHWRLFLRRPVLSAGLIVFKAVQALGGVTGIAIGLLGRRERTADMHRRLYRE